MSKVVKMNVARLMIKSEKYLPQIAATNDANALACARKLAHYAMRQEVAQQIGTMLTTLLFEDDRIQVPGKVRGSVTIALVMTNEQASRLPTEIATTPANIELVEPEGTEHG